MAGDAYSNAKIPAGMTSMLLSDYPEIDNVVRFTSEVFDMFKYEDKKFFEPHFFYADNSVFRVFSYSLIRGDVQTALQAPNTIVLTEETARKYFCKEDPMGKVIRFNDKADLTVTGIMHRYQERTTDPSLYARRGDTTGTISLRVAWPASHK